MDGLLVEDCVEDDGGLARLPIADDELALPAADRDQSIHRLEPRRHGLVNRAARDDTRRLDVDPSAFLRFDWPLPVDRIAKRVNHATQKSLAHRHFHDGARALDRVALLDVAVRTENHDAD